MQLVLQLTRDCNLACRYCYQRHRKGAGMTAEVAERAVEWALRQGNAHIAVTYFGGEPLLERATIERGLPRLHAIGARRGALVTAKVSTNGALVDAAFARFAREHALFVSLSTDGSPQAQDLGRPAVDGSATSALVEGALAHLVEARTPFATYQVITPDNARALARSTDWLFERGSRILISTLDFSAEWTERDLARVEQGYRALARRYLRWTRSGVEFYLAPFDSKISAWTHAGELRKDSCSAGIRQIAVDPEGHLYPCIEFLESAENRIGHIDRGLDKDAWRAFNARHGGKRPEECSDCGIAKRCGSSCACLNFRLGGKLRSVDALLCAHERVVTLAADRLGAALWKKRAKPFLRRQYDPFHHSLSALESLFEEFRKA